MARAIKSGGNDTRPYLTDKRGIVKHGPSGPRRAKNVSELLGELDNRAETAVRKNNKNIKRAQAKKKAEEWLRNYKAGAAKPSMTQTWDGPNKSRVTGL